MTSTLISSIVVEAKKWITCISVLFFMRFFRYALENVCMLGFLLVWFLWIYFKSIERSRKPVTIKHHVDDAKIVKNSFCAMPPSQLFHLIVVRHNNTHTHTQKRTIMWRSLAQLIGWRVKNIQQSTPQKQRFTFLRKLSVKPYHDSSSSSSSNQHHFHEHKTWLT